MDSEIDAEIFDLIMRLQQMQDEPEALAEHQHDLSDQLKTAEEKVRAVHRKILEKQSAAGNSRNCRKAAGV